MPATTPPDPTPPTVSWQERDETHHARWRSEAGLPPPRRIQVVGDELRADAAWRLACEGTALLWRGDYHNARQLLQAMGRRVERSARGKRPPADPTEAFHRYRMAQAQRARTLGMLLVPLESGFTIPLRRAPDVGDACREAWGDADPGPGVTSLRELLGIVGAHEWRRRGVPIAALGGAAIHPHYGVFSPVRGEYLELVARAPLPPAGLAFDIGTGTGVLAAILVRRGVAHVVATELNPRALACARDNLDRLSLAERIEVRETDLFPPGEATLIVCNPPWLPGRPSSPLEAAIYDPDSRMLRGFLAGLRDHLAPRGEGWLILSDLAEHLGLRSRADLDGWIADAGLHVIARDEIRPHHPKAADPADPLHRARAAEKTALWRLGRAA